MAVGWARDGAVQAQVDANVDDAVQRARASMPIGESKAHCTECEEPIPDARRKAIPGVCLCVTCQAELEAAPSFSSAYNRRGSKDSQLK